MENPELNLLDMLAYCRPEGSVIQDIFKAGNRNNLPRQMVTKNGELIDVVMSSRMELDHLTGQKTLFCCDSLRTCVRAFSENKRISRRNFHR